MKNIEKYEDIQALYYFYEKLSARVEQLENTIQNKDIIINYLFARQVEKNSNIVKEGFSLVNSNNLSNCAFNLGRLQSQISTLYSTFPKEIRFKLYDLQDLISSSLNYLSKIE